MYIKLDISRSLKVHDLPPRYVAEEDFKQIFSEHLKFNFDEELYDSYVITTFRFLEPNESASLDINFLADLLMMDSNKEFKLRFMNGNVNVDMGIVNTLFVSFGSFSNVILESIYPDTRIRAIAVGKSVI